MKHKGSKSDFIEDRNLELMRVFKEELMSPTVRNTREALRNIVDRKASRFYVSEMRVKDVLRHYRCHGCFPRMGSLRHSMFSELEKRYRQLRQVRPQLSEDDAIYAVVNSEAPSFYLTPGSLRTIIYKLFQ